jgi:hypothetical protein
MSSKLKEAVQGVLKRSSPGIRVESSSWGEGGTAELSHSGALGSGSCKMRLVWVLYAYLNVESAGGPFELGAAVDNGLTHRPLIKHGELYCHLQWKMRSKAHVHVISCAMGMSNAFQAAWWQV